MNQPVTDQRIDQGLTRRTVLRRAAYTAPAVIAIAAAPNAALAGSGPKKFPGKGKGKAKGKGKSKGKGKGK